MPGNAGESPIAPLASDQVQGRCPYRCGSSTVASSEIGTRVRAAHPAQKRVTVT
jgi:hypothetical protein